MLRYVGDKGAGLLMLKEIEFLSRLLGDVEKPYLAIIGGAKVSDKIGVLEALAGAVDKMLIGGAMANTFLRAQGHKTGKSKVEEDKLPLARSFLKKVDERGVPVLLPRDVVAATSLDGEARVTPLAGLGPEEMALDIGPETVRGFADEIATARTIFWNGPMGVFEKPAFAAGTVGVARAVATNRRALSVVGGGDSVAAIEEAGVADQISHLSTGGGASLEFVEGKTLPGIAALES
jgi:phosphoglycerate kinase